MRKKHCQKAFSILPIILLIFLIFHSVIAALPPIFAIDGTNEAWKRDIGRNICGLTVVDGRVFTTTHASDLLCLDQQNGQTLWTYNFGELSEGGFLTAPIVAGGKVFVGSRGSTLNCLYESNGSILWRFAPAYLSSSFAAKSPPIFSVADGKVFTTGDGFYVLNAFDGKLLWGYEDYRSNFVSQQPWAATDDHVFLEGLENTWYLYGLDADNGRILWKHETFTYLRSSPLVTDGRVIVWNYDEGQIVLCLDETDGSTLWSYDVGATGFQPTAYNGLLLFGASNGDFYALNESDGTLKWKYQTNYQVVTGNSVSPIVTSDKVFTSYEDGYIRSLNLSNGQSIWAAPVSSDVGSLTLGNRTLYVIAGASNYMTISRTELYSIDADTGIINWIRNFTYWVLPPIYAYDKLFVAADLKVIAYGEAEPAKNESLRSLLIAAGVIAVGAAITVAVYWPRRRRELISNAHA